MPTALAYCKASVLNKAKGKAAATLIDGEGGYATFQEVWMNEIAQL
jgi:hypothetical protein